MGSRGKPDLKIRPKCNPIRGELPVLQYCALDQLHIDETYQRTLEAAKSITLVRRIATHWDWGLCQPLFVARRADGQLYVVDGQHRLAAARLRGDVWQLPCVVRSFDNVEDEAAAFVALNQERTPLTKLQIFKAALAAGDFEASQIVIALTDAGLSLAGHSNYTAWKPAEISNVGGLQGCYRAHGVQVLTCALDVLAQSYKGQVLRYAGMIFPGIVAIVAAEVASDATFADGETFALMTEMVGGSEQREWVRDILSLVADDPSLNRKLAASRVFEGAWRDCIGAMLDDAA